MRKNKFLTAFFVLFTLLWMSGCASIKKDADTEVLSSMDSRMISKVMENYEDGAIHAEDVAIDKIYYGAFSQTGRSELLVLCKILNMPHVGGLEQTVGVLLDSQSLEAVAYQEFPFDEVSINCVPASNGQSRILLIGTTISQGIPSQCVQLLGIEEGEWIEMPIDALKTVGNDEELFCFWAEDRIIVSSQYKWTSPEEIIAILIWNPDTEQFTEESLPHSK
ncbi:MAG: hypothetical protein IJV50_04520 [Lachnospiraceae bacterium]|nr:hypothetical protein [Lachnospiraceae bacterium]